MRVLFLGNNWTGWQVAKVLADRGEDVVGAVVHPVERQRHAAEILAALQLPSERVFDGSSLGDTDVRNAIAELRCDIAVSVFFGFILDQPFLDQFAHGCVNLHPSYLPYNRGAHPNVWSIVDGTPAGVTLHYLDSGIDTGDIISQEQVEVALSDTGETLYRRLEGACVDLFTETWPAIREGRNARTPQIAGYGTSHRVADLAQLDEIHLDERYTGRGLIDRLRARTFSGHSGCFFQSGPQRIYLRLELESHESSE